MMTYHVAGDVVMGVLDGGIIGIANSSLVGAGRDAEQAVQIIDGHALASHGRLQHIVGHTVCGHFETNAFLQKRWNRIN